VVEFEIIIGAPEHRASYSSQAFGGTEGGSA